ncbi:MAG: GNAT family N-acetyltransferase [Clostridia bacterium]|nr:GNAT family N-acetyltransferase [Clostridia bacterium]
MNDKRLIRIFSHPPVLTTERLILRELRKTDAKDMFEYAGRRDVVKFLTWEAHPDEEYTRRFLEFVSGKYKEGTYFDWAVIKRSEGKGRDAEPPKMIGTCGFTRIDTQNFTAEIGYVINPDYRGHGYAPEACEAVLDFAFNKLEMNRVEARYIIGNDASRRVMDKLGMRFEGVLRESLYLRGDFRNVGICSILEPDYYHTHH